MGVPNDIIRRTSSTVVAKEVAMRTHDLRLSQRAVPHVRLTIQDLSVWWDSASAAMRPQW